MDRNPGNLRWFYILDDIFEAETDPRVQAKIKKCQDSLTKFPLVIHNPDQCLLLRHFDDEILLKIKERLRLESTFLGTHDEMEADISPIEREAEISPVQSEAEISPVKSEPPDQIDRLAKQFEEEEEKSRREQEENDFKLAMKLSQEYDDFQPVVPEVQGEMFPKPSAAFELSKTFDNSLQDSVSMTNEELRVAPQKIAKNVHELSLSSSDEEIENKPPPSKKMNSLFKQDPIFSQFQDSSDEDAKLTKVAAKKSKAKKTGTESAKSSIFSQDPIFARLDNLSSDNENDDEPQPKNSRKKKQKEPRKKAGYCPKPQSGGYAILIALYKEESNPDYKGFMTKSELCEAAQPFASESMTYTKPGSTQFYNGWSASSILAKKELIEMWSNPRKIRLTDAGRVLAKEINDKREQASEMLSQNSSQGLSTTFDNASWLKDVPESPRTTSCSRQILLKYCYVTVAKEETNKQSEAELDVDDAVYYLIKCNKSDLEKSGKRFNLRSKDNSAIVLAFLHEDDCDEQSPCSNSSEFLDKMPKLAVKKHVINDKPPALDPNLAKSICLESIPSSWSRSSRSENYVQKYHSGPASGSPKMLPGQYEIILIVDMMEVTGGSSGGKKSRKNITPEELQTLGISYETRKLSIGDFVWIAKDSFSSHELVLPYIVERKRMDDLRSSIMDGRYKEQKQRIHQCGLPNKIYLVEEIGHYKDVSSRPANQGFSKALDRNALDQAMSNTLIRDGFHVKVTKSQRDSMKFLASMTTTLQRKYARAKLYQACDFKEVEKDNHLLPFKDFYEHSRPDKALTVREIFCNMLICQKGLSAGVAWAITEKYPTFRALKNAYDDCETEEAKEKLVSGIPYDNGKKKVSLSVSRTLCWLFNERDYQ